MIYLPKLATVEQAEEYLSQKTGEAWPLSRLIEYGMVPYFWLDYTDESAALFDGKREGFLVRMLFQPDLSRLEACPDEVLVQIFARPDDSLIKADPPFLIPITELRFQREDVEMLIGSRPDTTPNTPKPVSRAVAQDAAILQAIRSMGYDPLKLPVPPAGRRGVKADVRAALEKKNQIFPTRSKVFEKAWQRLRDAGEISDSLPYSPKLGE